MTMDKAQAMKRVKRIFHRHGVLAVEEVYAGRLLHGRYRTWHRNGQLASVRPHRHGRLHGLCQQWNEQGQLLGSFQMRHGTGIYQAWHDNGQVQLQHSMVKGLITGCSRVWLRDGSLLSEEWFIGNEEVSKAEYLEAAASHPDWPQYAEDRGHRRVLSAKTGEARAFRLHCAWLLSKGNYRAAAEWLKEGDNTNRSLGRLGFQRAKSLIDEVYQAGARRVLAMDVYSGGGKQFSDALLVGLPRSKNQREAIRQVFRALSPRLHCAVQPDKDGGEPWLYVYFG